MPTDLFARAKGPRVEISCPEIVPCPWCREDAGEAVYDDSAITCPHCHREFLCPDERGELVCVGLLSPADMAYLAEKGSA